MLRCNNRREAIIAFLLLATRPPATPFHLLHLRSRSSKLVSKLCNHRLILRHVGLDIIDILLCLALDLFGPVSVFESVVGVLIRERGGTNIRNHHSYTIASQRVLQ